MITAKQLKDASSASVSFPPHAGRLPYWSVCMSVLCYSAISMVCLSALWYFAISMVCLSACLSAENLTAISMFVCLLYATLPYLWSVCLTVFLSFSMGPTYYIYSSTCLFALCYSAISMVCLSACLSAENLTAISMLCLSALCYSAISMVCLPVCLSAYDLNLSCLCCFCLSNSSIQYLWSLCLSECSAYWHDDHLHNTARFLQPFLVLTKKCASHYLVCEIVVIPSGIFQGM